MNPFTAEGIFLQRNYHLNFTVKKMIVKLGVLKPKIRNETDIVIFR